MLNGDIQFFIEKLKRTVDAIILAHNYQSPNVQDIADFVGDSLQLSIKAMNLTSKIIVFAGVYFMAEQASILARGKTVLIPDFNAKCPMAAMINPEIVRKARDKYPHAPIVIYVNTTADVKAEADYIVTSSSAVKLVSQLEADTIIFGPDKQLAEYVEEKTGKTVIPIPPHGHCPVHLKIKPEHILNLKKKLHYVNVAVHPECLKSVRRLADYIGSTGQMLNYVKTSANKNFIIGTEIGLTYRISKECAGKMVHPACKDAICINMKKITLEKILRSLREHVYPVKVSEKFSSKVMKILERSYELLGVDVPWRRS